MIGLVPAEKLVDYVGQEIGSSDWFEVDQDRIDMFADATLDHQFIHIDSEKATPLLVQQLRMDSYLYHWYLI